MGGGGRQHEDKQKQSKTCTHVFVTVCKRGRSDTGYVG